MSEDITISRAYFQALLRRVEQADTRSTDCCNAVKVPIEQYRHLQKAAIEYDALKKALVNGGTPLESIQILIDANLKADTDSVNETTLLEDGSNSLDSISQRWRLRSVQHQITYDSIWSRQPSEPLTPMTSCEETSFAEEFADKSRDNGKDIFPTCREDRSVVLEGLPKHTTLADVTKLVRGGAVLNLFFRPTSSTAHVAFIEPDAAERFIIHAKRHDLYIKSKRIQVGWDKRQHYMVGSISRRITQDGATRNLVIRFPKRDITEDVIRDDLDHIHLLEVVSISFRDGHAWISLNGVKQATSARACMLSRLRYKGYRIDFWPDECAEQLLAPIRVMTPFDRPNKHKSKACIPSINRFNVLIDEDESSDVKSDTDHAL